MTNIIRGEHTLKLITNEDIQNENWQDKIYYRNFLAQSIQPVKISKFNKNGFPIISVYMKSYDTWKPISSAWKDELFVLKSGSFWATL